MPVTQFEQYSDAGIIQKILNGEEALYEILIRRYNASLYKIGRAYHYSHHDTEDLMQDAYISAFYGLAKLENHSFFKTWISKIMLNLCFHKKQRLAFKNEIAVENHHTENAEPMFHQNINTEKTVVNRELGHVLETVIHSIPEDYRLVFTLRELNGFNVAETAAALSISESNVKTRLNRARQMMRTAIEKMYSPAEVFEFNLIYCDSMVQRVMERIGREKRIKAK